MTDQPLEFRDAPDFPKPDYRASDDSIADKLSNGLGGLRRKPRASTGKTVTVEPQSKPGEFTESIGDFYRTAALFLLPFDPSCAMVVLEEDTNKTITRFDGVEIDNPNFGKDRAQLCAEALDEAAQKSPRLRKTLRMLTTGGVWGKVAAAHAPIILAALSHHAGFAGWLTGRAQRDNVPG